MAAWTNGKKGVVIRLPLEKEVNKGDEGTGAEAGRDWEEV